MPEIAALSNKKMHIERRLDDLVSVTGALIPVGLVVGNIGFETLIAATGLFWIGRCFVAKKNPLPDLIRHPLILPWMIWFGCIALSLILNGQGSKGWAHDVSFVRFPLFALAMIDSSRRRPVVRYCLFGLAAGVVLSAINTLSAYIMGFDLLGNPLVLRYTRKLKEAGRITGLCAYAASFSLTWALMDKRLTPRVKQIITVIGLIAVALTFQFRIRTAIIAMLTGLFPVLLYRVKKQFSWLTAMGTGIFLIACVVIFFHFRKMEDLSSLHYRFYIWKISLMMWRDHPWIGVGVSAFQDVFTAISTSGSIAYLSPHGKLINLSWASHSHNTVLMLMSTTGILGVTTFGWLFVNSVKMTCKKIDGWRWGLMTLPIVMFVFGLTGFNIYDSWYLTLVAYILVLIGMTAHSDELSNFYTT